VRDRFWAGRRFRDLSDLNLEAATWRDDFANRREHVAERLMERAEHFIFNDNGYRMKR
jgi:hypothetical protein